MSVPDRIYRIAKATLDAARGRLDDIDQRAASELEQALGPGGSTLGSTSDDPMVRAAAKIAASRASARTQRYNFSTSEPTQAEREADPVQTAYRVIGVPYGSDMSVVDKAVAELRSRAAPDRFPEGSPERDSAIKIHSRIDNAYAVLQDAKGQSAGVNRFDRLEL